MASPYTQHPSSREVPRLTKIVATLGPASQGRLDDMIRSGVNVFRLNFSHGRGDYSQVIPLIRNIREASARLDTPVAILGDLQGPKFRIGELENHQAVTLVPGARLRFSVGTKIGTAEHVYTKNAAVVRGLSVGHKVLLDDGFLELKVVERLTEDDLVCEVVVGGKLGEKKGINVPDIIVSSRLSEKDKEDTMFAIEQGLDYIALSFVQTRDDVIELREFMAAHAHKCGAPKETMAANPSRIERHMSWAQSLPLIISKIEKPQAVDNIISILDASDGLMVARGDMGVEMSLERVPAVQKYLIELCNACQKPCITATQMLQSMIDNPVPTRAEVSDVANAVYDGTDCVMLSAESAVGQYPTQAVETQARIIMEAERNISSKYTISASALQELTTAFTSVTGASEKQPFYQTVARISVTAARLARASCIIAISHSGLMALRISKAKPGIPVIGLTTELHSYRRMALLGGVHPLLIPVTASAEETLAIAEKVISAHGFAEKGDTVVFCAGTTATASLSNTVKLYSFGAFAGTTTASTQ